MITACFRAWASWTAVAGPPTDALGLRQSTRCLRAAAHVLGRIDVPSWAETALVVGSATGDPDASPGTDPLAQLPLRLGEVLRPRSITSICAGTNTVAMSLIETFCRLHTRDRIVVLVVEPAPAAELAVAFAIDSSSGPAVFRLEQTPPTAAKTASTPRFRNPCQPALQLAEALEQKHGSVHLGDRWTITISWRDAVGHSQ